MKTFVAIIAGVLAVALTVTACDSTPDQPGPGPDFEPGPGSDFEPGPGSDSEPGPGSDFEPGPGSDFEPGPQSSSQLVSGSGTITTETHDTPEFNRIELAGEGQVVVMIGDDPGLTVRTDDNLHDYLEVAVSNGTLRLATRGDGAYDIDPTDSITWTVHTPQAIALHLSGAGFIGATGVQADRLEVVVDGVGDIDLADVEVTNLSATLSGVGTINASGTAQSVDLSLTGIGDIDTSRVQAATGAVWVSSAGNIVITATDSLDVDGTGLGTVTVHGSPLITGEADRVTQAGS
jgi:hypothetical protein